jgi:16S rRNA pseudouridine516 synthase
MRWSQILFSQGFGTRRECEALVAAGRIAHDGRTVGDDADIEPIGVEFRIDGRSWPYQERALVLLHKPSGYECSQKPRHHPSVLSLLPPPLRMRGVQPVGRLDEDTTGALLLTDDGALIHRLTSPKHHVPKVYEVTCRHALDARQLERLVGGVVLDDDPKPVRAAAAERTGDRTLRLTLTEGKYHQVKRMLAAVGNRVEALHRSAFGALDLAALPEPGQWRWIDDAERARALVSRPQGSPA